MRTKTIMLSLLMSASCVAQQDFEWKADVERMLSEFLVCGGVIPENSPCNEFAAQALARVYGIHDFDKAGDGFMLANDIANFVEFSDKWEKIGQASDQAALTAAQDAANAKQAVVAVFWNSVPHSSGHVAMVLPGYLKTSGQWHLDCPNSASFLLNHPEKSYVGKMLSFAYGADMKDNVTLYKRKAD